MKQAKAAPSSAARTVPCPACGNPSRYAPDNPWRPFCSKRCKLQDLGAWASESFRLDAEENQHAAPDELDSRD